MKTVAVIPARGGSKGIPRKNMRLMAGKPLIAYSIESALACREIDVVIVSSDSEEILSFASQYEDVIVLPRGQGLAEDAVTLDPVIFDAITRWELMAEVKCDVVVTLQPTSPLLSVATLGKALAYFEQEDFDSLISVVNSPHLSWVNGKDGKVEPAYERRLNRQQLPPYFLETGSFLMTKRESLGEGSRIGGKVGVFEVPLNESTDIDTRQDWLICESLLRKKKIAFRVDGYKELGLGHIYRALTLAYDLIEHEVVFICDARHREGIEKLRSAHMPIVEVENDLAMLEWLKGEQVDILVNDRLDTTEEYIKSLRPYVERIVTFEDLGSGSREADAVINAIYENGETGPNVYTGKKYVCLRDEFLTSVPREFSEKVHRILVMFGGTDPLDLSHRVYRIAREINKDKIVVEFDFVLGPGYAGSIEEDNRAYGIEIHRDVVRVSDHMRSADMALSSQGRTTFELAAMGVPTIVLSQNERELLHTFAQMDNGFINLGLGGGVSDEDIAATICWLMDAPSVRKEMRRLMLQNNLKDGIERVKRIVLGDLV